MDRKIISRRIADIQNNLSRLNNNICAMDSLDIQRYPENYETMFSATPVQNRGSAGPVPAIRRWFFGCQKQTPADRHGQLPSA